MKVKIPPLKVVHQNEGRILSYEAFENKIDLCCLTRLEVQERKIGAFILNKGKLEAENQFQIVFAFKLRGIHNLLFPQEIDSIATAIAEATKSLIPEEKCVFVQGCYSKDDQRQNYLAELVKNCPLTLPSILLQNEQARVRELKEKGLRSQWEQLIFCTWSADQYGEKKTDWLSQLIYNLAKNSNFLLNGMMGKLKEQQEQFFIKLLSKAYTEGFLPWEMLLSHRAGLDISPLSEEELWQWQWQRFNSTAAPPIPQLLVFSQNRNHQGRIREIITNKFHAASVLIQGENGRSSCPEHRQTTAQVYVKNQVCGLMVMNSPVKAWTSRSSQLAWIWKILSQQHLKNIEMVVELSPANQLLVEDSLYRHAKQSKSQRERAFLKGPGRDAGAEVKAEASFEAQKKIYQGAVPLSCGVVFLVYDQSVEELSKACRLLSNSVGSAKVARERDIAAKVWLETLPITWSRLLHSSSFLSERRLILESDTVAGILPLTCPQTLDLKGVEFLSQEGGKSICVDLFSQTAHALVTGMTGSGKSVLLWRFMLDALARNIPVVGIDFPARDGESSFKTGIELLGDDGAYFDIARNSSNLMEPPDLRRFNQQEREMRLKSWLNFIREALLTIVMGRINHPSLSQRVDSILRRALILFLSDSEIIERYNQGFEKGWLSPEWQQMPVLEDFLRYCTIPRLQIKNPQDLDHQALSQIHSQIKALLVSPLGNALGKPSSFPPEPMIKFFALTGLSNDQDSFIMAVNANAACVRVALSHEKSLFVGDELSVLCRRDGFSAMLGTLCATARKDGLSILLSAQDPDTICSSSAAAMIMQNITYRITGKITANAANSYQRFLGYPAPIINQNASDLFNPEKSELYSCWLIEKEGRYWPTRFYPGEMILASLANNQEERKARQRVLQKHPANTRGQIYGLAEFTQQYIPALKDNKGFEHIGIINNLDNRKQVKEKELLSTNNDQNPSNHSFSNTSQDLGAGSQN
jgi:GTPase SAR1 family protein